LKGTNVVDVLNRLRFERSAPKLLFCDNGSEFTSQIMDLWAYQNGVKIDFSRPGKPTDNAYVESCNGTFRAECLDTHWFATLAEAKENIEAWRREYNENRSHRALRERTPNEFAKGIVASRNTVHLRMRMHFALLKHLLGARYLGRNGYLLILRFTPRGFHRFRLDTTRSSRISLRIMWWNFFLAGGGNSIPDRQLPANYAYRMEKREPVGIFRNRPSRFVHQLADGKVCQQKTMYLATVACDSSNPSFNSSPWMRGAPHRGLAKLILRIRAMTSRDTEGLPSGGRLFHLQYSRNPCRCQAITVSGLTIARANRQLLQKRESQTHSSRSARAKRRR
jgi:hypothetical protein